MAEWAVGAAAVPLAVDFREEADFPAGAAALAEVVREGVGNYATPGIQGTSARRPNRRRDS